MTEKQIHREVIEINGFVTYDYSVFIVYTLNPTLGISNGLYDNLAQIQRAV